jgi:ferric-dicitrate binding protein FerR (iron transport regulator)
LLVGLLTDLLRAVVDESVGHELSRFFASYEAARRRLRALGVLALTVLVLLLLAAIVWLLVGVVFLADRFPATGDPLVFAVGIAVGYALAVIAGLVYN